MFACSFGEQLRRQPGARSTDAEVARRAGLSPRRYGNYVTGDRARPRTREDLQGIDDNARSIVGL